MLRVCSPLRKQQLFSLPHPSALARNPCKDDFIVPPEAGPLHPEIRFAELRQPAGLRMGFCGIAAL